MCAQSNAQREWYERNRELAKERAKAWALANPERTRETKRRSFEKHREKRMAHARKRGRTEEARAKKRAYARKWRAANPDKIAIYTWRSSMRRRGAGDLRSHEAGEWARVLYADPCAYCGGPGGEIDHIDPITTGGSAIDPDNLTSACRSCNAQKYNKPLLISMLDRLAAL